MTFAQEMTTIALCALATILTRSVPFIVFSEHRKTPAFIQYIGRFLPSAVFGMLVIYCLKDVNITTGTHGIPEAISILATIGLHLWKKQMLISIFGGTVCYMLLVHFVF